MSLTILPRDGDPLIAQTQLQTIIDDVFTVVMIVCGEGSEIDKALQVAVGRSMVKPLLRRVVWCRNSDLLSTEQKRRFLRKDKAVTSVGLADKVAAALDVEDAQFKVEIELAFLAAERQTPDETEV